MPERLHFNLDPWIEAWHASALNEAHADEIMGERKADALIFDGPFSARTHEGHAGGKLTADRASAAIAYLKKKRPHDAAYNERKVAKGESGRRDIEYHSWSPSDVRRFCDIWIPRSDGWVVSLTDDFLAPAWRTSYVRHGLLPFAPLPLVETGSRVRMNGDGPSNWTCWVMVARPRTVRFARWRTLRGAYYQAGEREQNTPLGTDRIVGGKPIESMIEIVKDYSREGALVVDPTFGGCTTGLACLRAGRRFIGLELDEGRAKLGAERLAAELQHSDRRTLASGQTALFATKESA